MRKNFPAWITAPVLLAYLMAALWEPAKAKGNAAIALGTDDTLVLKSFQPVQQGGLGCFLGYYPAEGGGYVTGNNVYGDREKAQFFSLPALGYEPQFVLYGVLARFTYKTVANPATVVQVHVYEADTAAFRPGALRVTSNSLTLAEVAADGTLTYFNLPAAETFSDQDTFFVSLELPASSGDTLVLQSTQDGCRQLPLGAWERWADGTWHAMVHSWMLDFDLALFPVGEFSLLSSNGMTASVPETLQVSYVPGADAAVIRFEALGHAPARLSLIQSNGMVVQRMPIVPQQPVILNCSRFTPGCYLVAVCHDKGILYKPLCIVR